MKITLTWEQYRQLETSIMDLSLKLDRAARMVQDLSEDYFGYILTDENRWKLEADFEEHKIKSDIAFDYVYGSKKLVEQIEGVLITGGDVR